MNDQLKIQKMNEILEDESLIKVLSEASSKEEMQQIFNDAGLEMSLEEIDAFINLMNTSGGELNEAALSSVNGGVDALWIFSTSWKGIKKIAKACWNAGKWLANHDGI